MKIQRQRGFTLVELLTVISIILILAGLVIGVAGWAEKEGARKRATAEIQGMSTALESYKADNGQYPRDNLVTQYTDSLFPVTMLDPLNANAPQYQGACGVLYQALTGDGNNLLVNGGSASNGSFGSTGHKYWEPKPAQTGSNTGTGIIYVVDPFNNPYGYSTATSGSSANASSNGFNPAGSYDLWSTAGTTGIAGSLTTGTQVQTVWIKNW